MPYISVDQQNMHATVTEAISNADISGAGELNFLLTKLALRYMEINGDRYAFMNDVVGAFESAKAEFQRRVVNPYEKQKAHDTLQDPYEGRVNQ